MNGNVKKFSPAAEAKIEEIILRYPSRRSAVMPALFIAQEELGWINDEAIHWVAARLAMPPAHIIEVATFYTMYYKKPVGKYHLQICRTLSCMLVGAQRLTQHLEKRFGVKVGEVTSDGMWSFEEVECLGSCGTGPVAQINDVFFECLTPEKLDKILDQIVAEAPDLRFSTIKEELGVGLPNAPRSCVCGGK